ncbi:MAG: prenyltransferase [Candidatus Aminicenantes bacterium]|nr:prenyltransferase [Candidatus Aminicenantes bacterium]
MPEPAPPTLFRKWLTAARPWALPASTMPVVFGTSLAVVLGGARLDILRFGLALLGMVILHSAANMLSDVFDFKRGLDREVTPVSGAIVRGWLSAESVKRGAIILFVVGCGIGLGLAALTGIVLLIVGAAGVAVGAGYTLLKYHALGDLAVFLNFGLLGALGAWVVQTKSFSWRPVVWTVPMAMLVIGILHANNWRDIVSDGERRVRTFASVLGDGGSQAYYAFLVFGSMAIVLAYVAVPRLTGGRLPALPWTFGIVLLALPKALGLWGRARRRRAPRLPMDFVILDGATAQYNLIFGLLCTAALWLWFFIR